VPCSTDAEVQDALPLTAAGVPTWKRSPLLTSETRAGDLQTARSMAEEAIQLTKLRSIE